MMKVAFDYQAFFIQEYGGISRYYSQLASALNTFEGVEAKIFASLHINAHLEGLPAGIVRGRSTRGRSRSKKLYRGVNTVLSRIQMGLYRPDVVHETYWSAKSVAPRGVPLVVTVHDMIHERFPEMFPRKDRTSILKRESVERADHVICVSNSTRDDLVECFGTPKEKISVVYHGFEEFDPGEGSEKIRFSGTERPYFFYVGHRSAYKNFDNFIRAFAASRELKRDYSVVCFGGGELSVRENTLFAEIGLEPSQVVHVGGNDDALAHCYRNAFAFVYPSVYEGFGIPPLEAMSLDCPVICSVASSIPEVVGDAAEFFDAASVDSIRKGLERVAASSSRRNELIRLGRERYRVFTWPRCAQETLAIYESLI